MNSRICIHGTSVFFFKYSLHPAPARLFDSFSRDENLIRLALDPAVADWLECVLGSMEAEKEAAAALSSKMENSKEKKRSFLDSSTGVCLQGQVGARWLGG